MVNVDPGNPGYLTGPNFDTGVGNIAPSYALFVIGYDTPIVNRPGDDFGIVVARYSTDNVAVAVSTNGSDFSNTLLVTAGSAVNTGVGRDYFSTGLGPFASTLFVHPIDLTAFGVGPGTGVTAIRITGGSGATLDLVRVAGFAVVPLPSAALFLASAVGVLRWLRRSIDTSLASSSYPEARN